MPIDAAAVTLRSSIAAACAGPSGKRSGSRRLPTPPEPDTLAGDGVSGLLKILDGCVEVTEEAGEELCDCLPPPPETCE